MKKLTAAGALALCLPAGAWAAEAPPNTCFALGAFTMHVANSRDEGVLAMEQLSHVWASKTVDERTRMFNEWRLATLERVFQSDLKELGPVHAGTKMFDECMQGRYDYFAAD